MMNKFLLFLLLTTFTVFAQKKLPDLSLNSLEGKTMSLTLDFSEKDKIYIFSFWATWCGPCINELDEMNDLQIEWKKKP